MTSVPGTGAIRVVVADDQAVARAGFRAVLSSAGDIEVVGEASDGAEAAKVAADLRPDVVLMDVRMPGCDGIEGTRRIAALDGIQGDQAPIRVLVVTTFDLDTYVVDALRAGAAGFVLKDIEPDELQAAVRTVHAGHALLAPAVTGGLIERFVRTGLESSSRPEPPTGLTPRELEVLVLVARGLTNAEIAVELYVAETTVKTHVSHLLAKLDLRDRVQLVVLAFDTGLALGPSR